MGRAARWLRSLLGRGRSKDVNRGGGGGEGGGEKKRSSFSKLNRHSGDGSTMGPKMEHTRMREEQNKHAIAVAEATAVAADAAVAAAQAAAEVVRLTSHGFGGVVDSQRCLAVVKIQIAFRGFLAKKALRALKALVKLQALFRGYLVRKQAAATLHSMQALIRAQNTVRAHRSAGADAISVKYQTRYYSEIRPRSSMERFEESRSEHTGSLHSRRLSASSHLDSAIAGFEDSPKIVEIDPGRPKSRNRRPIINNPTVSDTTTDESFNSPLPSSFPTAPATSEWCLIGDECRFSTAQSTPRFKTSSGQFSSMFATAATPAKSVCCDGSGYNSRYSNPNYMAKTESFNAKVRSHSAPKQRPEPRKRLSLQEMVESRSSLSGVGMMKSCSRAQEAISLKNTVVSRMTMIDRSSESDFYLQKRW